MKDSLRTCAHEHAEYLTRLCQEMIRLPSLSGSETAMAALVERAMRELDYDVVEADEVGNVVGTLYPGERPALMLTAHMDVVDPGAHEAWRHGPWSGVLEEGCLWGRGAVDDKASLAAMIVGGALVKRAGIDPGRPIVVVAAAGEEVGGYGARHLVTWLRPGLAIIGEPSANQLRRGHRGKFEIVVRFYGRSAHASAPQAGINPNYAMARFLLALRELPLRRDAVYGGTSVAPTLVYVDQTASNVIPSLTTVHLDWRNAPGETLEQALAQVRTVAEAAAAEGVRAEVLVPSHIETSYTGAQRELDASFGSVNTPADDPRLVQAQQLLADALGRPFEAGVWGFCTDGGHLERHGIPCIGIGPGSERMAHVLDERVAVAELQEAMLIYAVLAAGLQVEL